MMVDQGIYGHVTLRTFAVLGEDPGDRSEAVRLWKMVHGERPGATEVMARGLAARCSESNGFRQAAPIRSSLLQPPQFKRRCQSRVDNRNGLGDDLDRHLPGSGRGNPAETTGNLVVAASRFR
jgi:hypothetical protein